MDEYDLVIHGGTVVTGISQYQADVCIKDGRIASITSGQSVRSLQAIDASGKLVLPGVIDAHVHMQIMQQDKYATADDFTSGTCAAAAGGVTTIIDFFTPEGKQSLQDAFQKRRDIADPQVLIDYGLHCSQTRESRLEVEIDALIEAGVTSYKHFQVYGRLALNDDELYQNFELISRKGALATLHAENGRVVDLFTNRLRQQGETRAINLARSRPPFVEAACIHTAATFASECGAYLLIVHTSSGAGLKAIKTAQRSGQILLSETCPQYLLLSEENLAQEDGNLYICTPPLRTREDQAFLWAGLAGGYIHTLATDHCCFYRQQKMDAPSFFQAPGGVGTVELLLPLIYSEGVRKDRINLSSMVRSLSYNPAAIFGLLPQKGQITPGADADLVVFDPNAKWVVDPILLHGKDDYSAYQGFLLQGKVEVTVSRGEIIYRDGKIKGKAGRGRYLKRNLPQKAHLEDLVSFLAK